MSRRTAGMLLALLALSACGSAESTAGGASPSEARELDAAADALDANSVSANALVEEGGNAH